MIEVVSYIANKDITSDNFSYFIFFMHFDQYFVFFFFFLYLYYVFLSNFVFVIIYTQGFRCGESHRKPSTADPWVPSISIPTARRTNRTSSVRTVKFGSPSKRRCSSAVRRSVFWKFSHQTSPGRTAPEADPFL